MEAAVDVDHLAGGGGEPVGQQRHDGLRGGCGVGGVPPERCPVSPDVVELFGSGNGLLRDGVDGPGSDPL